MSQAWFGDEAPPAEVRIGALGWARVVLRGAAILVTLLAGLGATLLVRLVERPLFAPARPVTPRITQTVCRVTLWLLGLQCSVTGRAMREQGAVVANHVSWLDIFVLNARKRVVFVAKAEVAGWPGVNWLAKATGTLFIARERRAAGAQVAMFRRRLGAGHKLLFFPEGTSTDGRRVLPFKTTLFAAFFDEALRGRVHIQPVTLIYRAPPGQDPRFFGWWGDMALAPSLLKVLAQAPQGSVELVYHPPLRVRDHADRKSLARALEDAVRMPFAAELARDPPA